MAKDQNHIGITKVVFNSSPKKIVIGSMRIVHSIKVSKMIFNKILTNKVDQLELKLNKKWQVINKEKVLSKSKYWLVNKCKWMDKIWNNLFLMRWIKISITVNKEMKNIIRDKMICKMMEGDQIGAILQSTVKDSKIHFHKSPKINKSKISIRNFHNHLSNNM